MSQEEFNNLMSGNKPIITPWESALQVCESIHSITENMKRMEFLKRKSDTIEKGLENFNYDLSKFQLEITQTVEFILKSAPLSTLPIKTPILLIDQAKRRVVGVQGNKKCEPPCFANANLSSLNICAPGSQTSLPVPTLPVKFSVLTETSNNLKNNIIDVNYDFDFKETIDNYIQQGKTFKLVKFDPLLQSESSNSSAEFHTRQELQAEDVVGGNSKKTDMQNLIDCDEEQNAMLPAPLKPIPYMYCRISNRAIPIIACQTGDFSSSQLIDSKEREQEDK